ncbi:MAG: alpha/beta hydrolase [Nitrospiria bacterium]
MGGLKHAPDLKNATIQRGKVALAYTLIHPVPSKAAAIILHGLNDHKGRYRHLQEGLARAGYSSLAYDQRGFGLSDGKRADVADYREFFEDLSAIVKLLRKEHPHIQVVLIGHSLGGAIAAAYCIDHPNETDGLVLSSPAYDVPMLPFPLEPLAHLLYKCMPGAAFPYPNPDGKRSRDPAIDIAVAKDPLIAVKGTPRFYVEFRKMNRYLQEHAQAITLPTLILQGGADSIVRAEGARALFRRLGHPKNHLHWYEGFYHEVFHEIGHEGVIADLVGWLETALA